MPWIALAAWLIAFALSLSESFPDSTWKTIGLLPFCWGGKRSARTSVAFWLFVPGRLRSLLVSAPMRETARANATTRPTQTSRTRTRWSAIHRPIR
jgi:hypothetical protein